MSAEPNSVQNFPYFSCLMVIFLIVELNHRLNMESDLQSLFGPLYTTVLIG
jgi:hypothetical protein